MRDLHQTIAKPHLPALDGLRAVSVLVVMFYHSNLRYRPPGDLGVSAFFVLSGFLITRLLIQEYEKTDDLSFKRFYARRTLRIFPAYYAFLFLSYLADLRAGQPWNATTIISGLTYTVNYVTALGNHPAISIAHAWSLAVEEQFYLVWPLAFLFLARRRALVKGLVSIALLALVWRTTHYFFIDSERPEYAYNAFDTRLDNLAVGCLLAVLITQARFNSFAKAVATRSWYPVVTIALILVSRLGISEGYRYSLGFTVNAVLVGILIVQFLQLYEARLWRWLEWKWVRYLGTISYPMYLYHQWGSSVGRRAPIFQFGFGIAATILLASLSFYVVERPFLRLRNAKRRVMRLDAASLYPIGLPER